MKYSMSVFKTKKEDAEIFELLVKDASEHNIFVK